MSMHRFISIVILLGFLSGCAYVPQSVAIYPMVNIAASNIGNGRDIYINVIDERAKRTLGTVASGNVGADISIDGDLTLSIQKSISDALSKMNFNPSTHQADSGKELRIEIRNLDYITIFGFSTGTIRVDTGLKAILTQDSKTLYQRFYRSDYSADVIFIQDQVANTRHINTSISTALNNMLTDQELIKYLVMN